MLATFPKRSSEVGAAASSDCGSGDGTRWAGCDIAMMFDRSDPGRSPASPTWEEDWAEI